MKKMFNFRERSQVEKFSLYFSIFRFVCAIVLALVLTLILMVSTTSSPLEAIKNLFIGPLTTMRRFSTVLETAIPLTFSGLAICLMFTAKQFNLAVEGGFYLGALTAAIVVINLNLPPVLAIIIAMICAMVVSAFVCLIPSYFSIKWEASELVISLMLNYVCLYIGLYIFNHTIKDTNSAYQASTPFPEGISLGRLIPKSRLHGGLFIVLVVVVITAILLYRTKWGYSLRVVGNNEKFGRYAGMGTAGIILSSQLLGGSIAGLGGATEMIGMYQRFQWSTLPGFGFDGVVLNILARGNPLFIPVAAFAISYLRVGADYMYRQSDIASEIVSIIEALIIIFVASDAFLAKYKQKILIKICTRQFEKKGKKEQRRDGAKFDNNEVKHG